MKVNIPDAQTAHMDALEEAFNNYLDSNDIDIEDYHWLCDEWSNIDSDPLVYTQEDLYEAGVDYDDGYTRDAVMLSMERDMADRIDAKIRFLKRLNEK